MTQQTLIVVNLQYEAIHCWPQCDIPEVSYLKHPHRHVFHIRAEKEVDHHDRDIEIIMFKKKILAYLDHSYRGNFADRSCEMIARNLLEEFKLTICEVLEDGENGAIVKAQWS